MALVSLPSPIFYPGLIGALSGGPALTNLVTVSSAGHYGAYIFCARENMTISHVGFRAGTATGSPTVEARIETVDTSGLPSGTLWATNTNATSGTITTGSNPLIALTASASITKGQIFCVKIAYASGTSQIIQNFSLNNPGITSLPYSVINTGTPTKGVTSQSTFALGSSSTTFYQVPGCYPITGTTNTSNFNNTNSAKRGLKFIPPFNCRIIGLRFYQATATGDYNAGIYDSSGAALGSTSTAFDGDQNANNGNGITYVYFSTALSATAGTTYYAAIEPTTATNTTMGFFSIPTSDYLTAMPSGSNAIYSAFATATWTDTNTQLPFLDVIIDQVDTGSGGGSTVVGVIGG